MDTSSIAKGYSPKLRSRICPRSLYELEDLVIDDLVVEINQTYEAQILKTETRTRLVGE